MRGSDDAAHLNPLSDEADLVAGNIALRLGDLSAPNTSSPKRWIAARATPMTWSWAPSHPLKAIAAQP